mgnify:CR=1 FL=1
MTSVEVEPVEDTELLPVIEEEKPTEAPPVKVKKPRSQAQIDAFVKVRAKIVKKAVSIRKKQIVREAVLDDISDEDIPVEIVKKLVKKYPKKAVAPVPVPAPVKQAIVFI